jgi:hypothetical protein
MDDASDIEVMYRDAMVQLSGEERVRRTAELYYAMRQILMFQVKNANPAMSPSELKWAVAKRFYLTDQRTQELIEQALQVENGK